MRPSSFYRWAVAALVLAALVYTLQRLEWSAVLAQLSAARAGPLVLAAFGVVLPLAARSLRAAFLLRRTGAPPLPLGRVAAVTIYGFSLSSLTPGGSGDLLRVAALRPYGVSARVSAAIVVYERALDLIVMAALLVVALAVSLLEPARAAIVVLGLALVALVGLGLLLRLGRDPDALAALAARVLPGFARAALQRIAPPAQAAQALLEPATLLRSLGYTVVVFVSEALRPWLVLEALGLEVGFFGAWAIFTLAWLAGLLSMLPLGIGSWETAAVWAFGLYGIGPSAGAAGALMLRAGVTAPAILAGLVSLLVLRGSVLGLRDPSEPSAASDRDAGGT